MKSHRAVFILFILLCLNNTTAFAYPAFVQPTGASGCTSCHNDSYGNGFKPGVLAAYEDDGLEGLKDYIEELENNATKNTKPVIKPINDKWDITVGEAGLTIPIPVYDAENDNFDLHGSAPTGFKFSDVYIDKTTQLPTIDFKWSPSADQANKTYQLSFYAREIDTKEKLTSETVKIYIQVWPARTTATRFVKQFQLTNATWRSNRCYLSGALAFKTLLSETQVQNAQKTLTMTIKSTKGETLSNPVKLTPNSQGVWYKTISLFKNFEKPPCRIRVEYEGLKAARYITLASDYDECED